jgi:hypothetical protein
MKATTAGGVLGHRPSYAISAFLQVVGRDLAGFAESEGKRRSG